MVKDKMLYKVIGYLTFKGLKKKRKFTKKVDCKSKEQAKNKIYSFFGNVYKIQRSKIEIREINKL